VSHRPAADTLPTFSTIFSRGLLPLAGSGWRASMLRGMSAMITRVPPKTWAARPPSVDIRNGTGDYPGS
jgi:hypothetical protein